MVRAEQLWRGVDLGVLLFATDVLLTIHRGGDLDDVTRLVEAAVERSRR